MNVVIDSSIFVEAVTNSVQRRLCLDLLKAIYFNSKIEIFEPVLLMYEVIIASLRASGDSHEKTDRLNRMLKILRAFKSREGFNIIDMDYNNWLQWYKTKNNTQPHRTQDEIFMSTTVNNRAMLLTLDHEMINKPNCLSGKCKVCAPYDGLKIIEKI